jgi:cobalamin biosynthesis protein CobT
MSEIFNFSFVLTLAITMVLVGAISFILYNKIEQQSVKMKAMMDLVTSVVSEVNTLKTGSGDLDIPPLDGNWNETNDDINDIRENITLSSDDVAMMNVEMLNSDSKLIDVSDGENNYEEDDDEVDSDDEDDSDDEEEEDEEEDEDEEEEEDDDDEDEEDEDEDNEEDGDEENENKMMENEDNKDNEPESKIISLKDELIEELDIDGVINDGDSKILVIPEGDTTIDYTKLTTSELKKLAVEKGLVNETKSKNMKKNKLVEMLSMQ